MPTVASLDPPRGLHTPLGYALATEITVWGQEDYIYYNCWIAESGENWTFDNREVRLDPNITAGHPLISPIAYNSKYFAALQRHKRSPLYEHVRDSTGAGCSR
jgi:hypothetical protein